MYRALLLLLLLTGCQSRPREAVNPPVTIVAKSGMKYFALTCWGLHTRKRTGDVIEINAILEKEPDRAFVVAAHELGHVFGLKHMKDKSCWMFADCPKDRKPQPMVPCSSELAQAKALVGDRSWEVIVQIDLPVMKKQAEAAAEAWNRALGRTVFTIRR